jgi:membrane protease YdiL (CAAX protease family)
MNELVFSRKRWFHLFAGQLLIALAVSVTRLFTTKAAPAVVAQIFLELVIIALTAYVQFKKQPNKIVVEITRWVCLLFASQLLLFTWLQVGNFFLTKFRSLEILWVILLWAAFLTIFLPITVLFASGVKNWLLRLIAVFMLTSQYGTDADLKVSKSLPWLHSITYQGVISALALLLVACFLGATWGYQFNPNLKFVKSVNFQNYVFIILLLFAAVDVAYNSFNDYNKHIWTVFFRYSVAIQPKYLTIPSFTSALEPGILEEVVRYLNILVILAAFKQHRQWRIPVAVLGSGILFGLAHLGNVGWSGQTLMATNAQVIGVMGSGFLWAVLYLYSGKLWLPMLCHFFTDYFANIQSGWQSAGWYFKGTAADYLGEFVLVGVPLAVSIWFMFGKRRLVLEENADRLLKISH